MDAHTQNLALYIRIFIFSYGQNGPTLCGGPQGDDCLTLSHGEWRVSHTLLHPRWYHTSWNTPDGGVLLVGGGLSPYTTEELTNNGDSKEMFRLKHQSLQDQPI